MSIDKNKRFDDNQLSTKKADSLYWEIKGIDEIINNFVVSKRRQQLLLEEQLKKIQEKCAKSKKGHDLRLFEKAQLEIDRDKLKCQKCGFKTT